MNIVDRVDTIDVHSDQIREMDKELSINMNPLLDAKVGSTSKKSLNIELNSSIDKTDTNNSDNSDYVSYNVRNTILIFFFPALAGLLYGYDIGASSASLEQIKDEEKSGISWYGVVADNSVLQGAITSAALVGAVIGSLVCFRIADRLLLLLLF